MAASQTWRRARRGVTRLFKLSYLNELGIFVQPLTLHNNMFIYHSHSAVWLLSIYTDCMCLRAHARACGLHVRAGERVHFDARFKVRRHYLFMPLLFLCPPRVRNSLRSILGRSVRTLMQPIPLRAPLTCTDPFRRRSLSIPLSLSPRCRLSG